MRERTAFKVEAQILGHVRGSSLCRVATKRGTIAVHAINLMLELVLQVQNLGKQMLEKGTTRTCSLKLLIYIYAATCILGILLHFWFKNAK